MKVSVKRSRVADHVLRVRELIGMAWSTAGLPKGGIENVILCREDGQRGATARGWEQEAWREVGQTLKLTTIRTV